MARAEQIKALIQSHGEGDDGRFYAVAMQMAARAARAGQAKFATEIRELVDEAKRRAGCGAAASSSPIPIVQPRGELAGLLTVEYSKARLSDMALDDAVRLRLERVLREQRQRDRLDKYGYSPARKLLLVGPPGTGKTMTASVLAGELGLPWFTIQLHGLITKYMGETAAKLRLTFDELVRTRGVYLFDEFDALGGERTSGNDVGEIRRVLSSFLLFLEQDSSESLVVAATNHSGLLDRALFRRFDAVIEYAAPSPSVAEKVMRSRLSSLDTSDLDWSRVSEAAAGLSHAEVARACEHAAKEAILSDSTVVETDTLVRALDERRAAAP